MTDDLLGKLTPQEKDVLKEIAVELLPREPQPVRNIVRQRAPKLSQEEQESRRAIKRLRRRERSERLSRAREGQSVGLRRAKAVAKERRANGS